MKATRRIFLVALATGALAACTKKSESSPPPEASAPLTAAAGETEVNLAIWGNYIAPEQAEMFRQKTGIRLNISNYSSNEELLAKLQAGATGYDVAVPSDYMVEIMSKMGLLEKLDRQQISNFGEISPEFLKQPFDSANEFSVPYAWSLTGIALQRDLYKGQVKSWKDLFTNQELSGKISLLDDAREALGAAARSQGLSYNATQPEDILKAKKTLVAARSRIKMFRSDLVDPLQNKEVAAAQAYMVDANQAWKKTGGHVDFVVPEDGTTFAIDNLVIVKGAKHPRAAHALINFLLSPEVNAIFVKNIMAGPVIKKTEDLLPADLKARFPSREILRKSEKIKDLGGKVTRLYDDAWTEVKSE